MTKSIDSSKEQTDIRFGRDELIIQNRYETAILFNDFLIALWFILGSVFFIVPGLASAGAWVFLIASIQFLIRPTMGLLRNIHLRKIKSDS
ncbi:YrhK family protein [Halothiobacillus sp.]|uniref:YrhK family protein n=1 Tax=Halothiobacillus sp. TaxID=1891311 RepID=UPI002615637B|nr:YrhK family protein [Halothiobacillus sp.]MDD4966035.1 YrhK family protein [Halothiobacillus sp.]